MSQPSSARQDRVRVSQACDICREKKARCDGAKPVCSRCRQKSLDCRYGVTKRIKNQQVMKELATKVAQYESILKKNIPAQQRLYHAEQQSSEQSSETPSTIDPALTSSMSDLTSGLQSTMQSETMSTITASPTTQSRRPSEILSPLFTATTISDTWSHGLLDAISIPPRQILERASDAFFEAAAILFTFFDEEEWNTLFESIYTNAVDTPSNAALAQVCATAAIGCQFYPRKFDEPTQQALISVTKFKLEECLEEEPLSSMRIMALLSMYYASENRTAATMYAGMGLRLAKSNQDVTAFHDYPSTPWQRVFNSLVFLDCWLCATTGHIPSSEHRELYSSIITIGVRSPSANIAVQCEMTKIAILSSSILQNVYHARFFSTTTVNSYKNQLQQWLLTLPKYMRLDHLANTNSQTRHLRSIFVVHLLYLNTVILVYRRVLVELGCCGRRLSDPDAFKQTQLFLEPCLWTGRQVAKILEIALSQGQVVQKCWMYVHTTYSTCNILLYFISNRLMQGDLSDELTSDLAAAQQCMDVLSFCAEVDKVANEYFDITSILHHELTRIRNSMVDGSNDDQTSEEGPTRYECLRRLAAFCASLLIHPFDGGFRRVNKILHSAIVRDAPDKPELLSNQVPNVAKDEDQDDEMLSPGDRRAVHQDSSHFFWKDFLCLRDLLSWKQDNGKGKETNLDSGAFPFTPTGNVVFGS